ncbi:uncharacterized protein Tco025E_09531, partial [Trypanosoma conorhini]
SLRRHFVPPSAEARKGREHQATAHPRTGGGGGRRSARHDENMQSAQHLNSARGRFATRLRPHGAQPAKAAAAVGIGPRRTLPFFPPTVPLPVSSCPRKRAAAAAARHAAPPAPTAKEAST